jgi:hypothetical protein
MFCSVISGTVWIQRSGSVVPKRYESRPLDFFKIADQCTCTVVSTFVGIIKKEIKYLLRHRAVFFVLLLCRIRSTRPITGIKKRNTNFNYPIGRFKEATLGEPRALNAAPGGHRARRKDRVGRCKTKNDMDKNNKLAIFNLAKVKCLQGG